MSLYGPTSVARALQSEHGGNVDDKFLEKKGVLGTLLRPPAWTRACAWKPGGACSRASEGDGLDNGRNSTVFAFSDQDQERSNFMGSLRLARSGAINQGVFTSGSLTADRRARVDAFVDRWHCRRSAQRSGHILVGVLEHLARRVRTRLLAAYLHRWRKRTSPAPPLLLRPKLFLLLDIRRRNALHKSFTGWGLLTSRLSAERRFLRRKGARVLRLLGRREALLKAVGVERWRRAVRVARDLERRKEACFERWKLFVLLCRHDSKSWGVERAMRLLRRMWLQHSAFDRLRAWRVSRAASRAGRDVLATVLVRGAWSSWRGAVARHRGDIRVVRESWSILVAVLLDDGRRKKAISSTRYRTSLLRKHLTVWFEASSSRRRSLRKIFFFFQIWARKVAIASRENAKRARAKEAAAALLMLLVLQVVRRRALLRWRAAVLELKEADSSVVSPPICVSPSPRKRSAVCRCVRCLRKYGRMGGRANRPRSGSARAGEEKMIVVTESRCDVNGHLELQLRSARVMLDKALRRRGENC